MKSNSLVVMYGIFAAISIGMNIGAQAFTVALYAGLYAIPTSMVIGTGAGLLCKYILDKFYIFGHKTRNAGHELTTFFLYCIMGIATTAVFWTTELLFQRLFEATYMRYVGAVIGLTVGYVIKYWLDKRLVFR